MQLISGVPVFYGNPPHPHSLLLHDHLLVKSHLLHGPIELIQHVSTQSILGFWPVECEQRDAGWRVARRCFVGLQIGQAAMLHARRVQAQR